MAVSLAAVVAMSEDEFKAMFKGVIATDINEAWKEVKKHQPKQDKPTQSKRPRKKSYKKQD